MATLLVGAHASCHGGTPRDIVSEIPLLLDADADGRIDLVFRRPGVTGSDEELVALTSPEHRVLWRTPLPESDGHLRALGSVILWVHDRELWAYERDSGALRWRATLPAEVVFDHRLDPPRPRPRGRVTAMFATEDRVYLRVRPNQLLLLDARSGEQLRF